MRGALSIMVPEGFEQVAYGHDAATGLRAIVAIHSTVLGPGLGGTRFWPFATEEEALVDVCRLAKGMTYKHAAAGLDQGGGKAVIIGDPADAAHRRADPRLRAGSSTGWPGATSPPRTSAPRRPTWTSSGPSRPT